MRSALGSASTSRACERSAVTLPTRARQSAMSLHALPGNAPVARDAARLWVASYDGAAWAVISWATLTATAVEIKVERPHTDKRGRRRVSAAGWSRPPTKARPAPLTSVLPSRHLLSLTPWQSMGWTTARRAFLLPQERRPIPIVRVSHETLLDMSFAYPHYRTGRSASPRPTRHTSAQDVCSRCKR